MVNRVITDLCVMEITPAGFEVTELASGVTRDQVQQRTEVALCFCSALV